MATENLGVSSERERDKIRVLFVDDNLLLGIVIIDYLEKEGFKTTHSTSPDEARSIILAGDTDFDVALLDIALTSPSDPNYEFKESPSVLLARCLRETAPWCRLVGYSNHDLTSWRRELGFDHFIVKAPGNTEQLVVVLRQGSLTRDELIENRGMDPSMFLK